MPERSNGQPGYLPGDPRYGLSGEALKDYYRTKAAQWAIYCWDKPGMADTRRALLAEQKSYVEELRRARHRLRPFRVRRRPRDAGHVVLHAARRPRGGGQVRRRRADEQGRRLSARRDPPLVEQLRQARGRLSPQGHAAVPVHGAEDRHARSSSASTCTRTKATSRRMATASSSAGRSARPTAPTTSAPRCCSNCRTARRRTSSGTRSRSRRTAGTGATGASPAGCSATDAAACAAVAPPRMRAKVEARVGGVGWTIVDLALNCLLPRPSPASGARELADDAASSIPWIALNTRPAIIGLDQLVVVAHQARRRAIDHPAAAAAAEHHPVAGLYGVLSRMRRISCFAVMRNDLALLDEHRADLAVAVCPRTARPP